MIAAKMRIAASSHIDINQTPATKEIIAMPEPTAKARKGSIPLFRIDPNIRLPNVSFPKSTNKLPNVFDNCFYFLFAA
jgi:hypothetical protein